MSLLNEYNETYLLLPFLSLKCEKNPFNSTLRQFLFNAYMIELWRIKQFNNEVTEENLRAKESLEYEIKLYFLKFLYKLGNFRNFLINFDSTPEVLSVLLKEPLWSSVSVLLSKDPLKYTLPVVRYLLDLPSLPTTNLDDLIKCFSFFHWPLLDSLNAEFITKVLNLIPSLTKIGHLRHIVLMAETLLNR